MLTWACERLQSHQPVQKGPSKAVFVACRTKDALLFLDEITEIFQLDGQVHIVDHHLFGNVENEWREIQDAHDAAGD